MTTSTSQVIISNNQQPAILDNSAQKYKNCVRNACLSISNDKNIKNLDIAQQLNLKSLYLILCNNITISQTALVELSIIKCQLSNIQCIGQMRSLKKLDLSQNIIKNYNELQQLENLLYLNLSNSSLDDISFLSGLIQLTNLNLNFNRISDISVLNKMMELTHLGVSNNKLKLIDALQSCQNLEYLDYENNTIDTISMNIILSLPNLREFIYDVNMLDHNILKRIKQINQNCLYDYYLSQLNKGQCKLNIDQTINTLKFLNRINQESKIQKIECDIIFNNYNISRQKIMLQQNNDDLRLFEEELTNLTDVSITYQVNILPRQLNLNLYEGIDKMKNLKKLSVYNQNYFEEEIVKIQKLQYSRQISYKECGIRYSEIYLQQSSNLIIPIINEFTQNLIFRYLNHTMLQELTLFNMEMVSVESLKEMTWLKSLNLSRNKIVNIQDLKYLTSLQILDLSGNHIKTIPQLQNMVKLEVLYLVHNQLYDISNIQDLASLKELDLTYNSPFLGKQQKNYDQNYDQSSSDPFNQISNDPHKYDTSECFPPNENDEINDELINKAEYNFDYSSDPFGRTFSSEQSENNFVPSENDGEISEANQQESSIENSSEIREGYKEYQQCKNYPDQLQYLKNLKNLEVLKLQRICDFDDGNSTILPSFDFKKLRVYILSDNEFLQSTNSLLASFNTLTTIQELGLRNVQLSSVKCLSSLRDLILLDVSNNKIKNISSLCSMKSLEVLNLQKNQVIDVTPLSELCQIRDLKLSDNKIQDIQPIMQIIMAILTDSCKQNEDELVKNGLRLSLSLNCLHDFSWLSQFLQKDKHEKTSEKTDENVKFQTKLCDLISEQITKEQNSPNDNQIQFYKRMQLINNTHSQIVRVSRRLNQSSQKLIQLQTVVIPNHQIQLTLMNKLFSQNLKNICEQRVEVDQ
ncbi:Conserved_hypothetical protein [Hexamita inflata]|uniref:Uncharacterized protein n=1 Tax=Hexamita inflata TaxID=28002 RepID=A0AA86NMN2_9EUKA|nr:Conserved hypothetical protein [Hexamita inflata]CAI9930210.1 Conserved hypothetical protein [Hexamita inflata]CAI9940553.1 Conserved hypothetical protein [Hexamita inflata]